MHTSPRPPAPADPDAARIQAILASGIKIPPLPGALLEVQALARQPDADARRLAAVIQRDAALSGALFRVVGSPVFGLRTRVDTAERAVSLLGISTTLAIVRGIALRAAFADAATQAALERLWQRSSQAAQAALWLVRELKPRALSGDAAYTLGLFHDCGLALALKRFPAYLPALTGPDWPDVNALDHAHDTDHALLGEHIARNWQLPEHLSLAIRHHHRADAPVDDGVAALTAVLNLALHLRACEEIDAAACDGFEPWRDAVQQRLGLDQAAVQELAHRFAAKV